MQIADAVPVTEEALAAIADRVGLGGGRREPLPSAGIVNSIYALGEAYVLRVPRNGPQHVAQARREASVIPAAVAAGVRTAALVAFDDTCELLPVPYLIVERLSGTSAESLPPGAVDEPRIWREVGRDLARVHTVTGIADDEAIAGFDFPDPRTLVDRRVEDGWISGIDARWLAEWLDRLAATGAAAAAPDTCVVHGDVQRSNVLVADRGYQALIDWGCARVDDPAADFLSMPLAEVPHVVAGHRDVAPLPGDDSAEARILWRRLQMLLAVLPRGAAPGTTWGERPIAWLIDLLRVFADPPERWRPLAPPPRETDVSRRWRPGPAR